MRRKKVIGDLLSGWKLVKPFLGFPNESLSSTLVLIYFTNFTIISRMEISNASSLEKLCLHDAVYCHVSSSSIYLYCDSEEQHESFLCERDRERLRVLTHIDDDRWMRPVKLIISVNTQFRLSSFSSFDFEGSILQKKKKKSKLKCV